MTRYNPHSTQYRGSVTGDSYRRPKYEGRPEYETVTGENLGTYADQESLDWMITQSDLYKQAYSLFSSRPEGRPYLSQLESIPHAFSLRAQNFWDDVVDAFGGTSSYDQLIVDSWNSAMDEIRLLIQQYHEHINSLPETQVEQFADAGINSAVTGQGIEGSSMSDTAVATANEPILQGQYSNEQLSQGITSFVEFLGMMSNITNAASGVVGAVTAQENVDLVGKADVRAQELHDLTLSKEGVTTSSPNRVLTPKNTPVIGSNAKVAETSSRIAANQLDKKFSVQVGNDSTQTAHYEIMTGEQVMEQMSAASLIERLSSSYTNSIIAQIRQTSADLLGTLQVNADASRLTSEAAEGNFNAQFFNSRNATQEGKNTTSISEHLAVIRQAEAYLKQFEQWKSEYMYDIMSDWGAQMHQKPHLAPYFYKALFDFNMADTFNHQSALAQGAHYGFDYLNQIGGFLANLAGFRKPPKFPKKVGQSSTTVGPKGVTSTDTTYHYE